MTKIIKIKNGYNKYRNIKIKNLFWISKNNKDKEFKQFKDKKNTILILTATNKIVAICSNAKIIINKKTTGFLTRKNKTKINLICQTIAINFQAKFIKN